MTALCNFCNIYYAASLQLFVIPYVYNMFGAYEPGLMYQYFIDYITVIKAMFSYGKYWALGHVLWRKILYC